MSKFELPRKPRWGGLWRLLPFGTILWTVLAVALLYGLVWARDHYHLDHGLITVLKVIVVVGAGLRIIRDIEGAMAKHRAQRLEAVRYGQARMAQNLAWQDTVTGIYLTRLLLYALLALVAVFAVGGALSGLVVGGTVISVMLGVAGQSFFANFFGGLAIALFKPFEVGDQVQIVAWQFPMMAETYPHVMRPQGYRGVIRDINLFYSELRLEDGQLMRVPNGVVITAGLVRFSPDDWARITFRFDINAALDVPDVLAKMTAAAGRHFGPRPDEPVPATPPGGEALPEIAPLGWDPPAVLIVDVSPTTVSIEVRGSVPQRLRDRAKAEFFADCLPYTHPAGSAH
ncbi:MAG: mechanosensitive ion channel family protein [Gammaproteobacteria bacterium]|nr:mechanosensitive ion channel family protein [Gammaproteobacteria bacterium]